MTPPSARPTFPVDSSSRRSKSAIAPVGDFGSAVSTLECSFGDLNINPSSSSSSSTALRPPSPRPTGEVISRNFMERALQKRRAEQAEERKARAIAAAAAAAAKRGLLREPSGRKQHCGIGREMGWEWPSASRVGAAGIAKKRQLHRERMAAATARGRTRWEDCERMLVEEAEWAREMCAEAGITMEGLTGDAEEAVEAMEEDGDMDDDMDDEDEDVAGDQRTREDSVMMED